MPFINLTSQFFYLPTLVVNLDFKNLEITFQFLIFFFIFFSGKANFMSGSNFLYLLKERAHLVTLDKERLGKCTPFPCEWPQTKGSAENVALESGKQSCRSTWQTGSIGDWHTRSSLWCTLK